MSFFGNPTLEWSGKLTHYDLAQIKDKGIVKEVIPSSLYMLTKTEDETTIHFAFFSVLGTGETTELELIMHGVGFSGNLRECRHTYWGQDGYIFYPDGEQIMAIFKELAVYFDDMGSDSK